MSLFKIILIILGIIVLLIVGTGIYFYKFHVFKSVRICIGNEIEDLKIPCSGNQECFNLVKNNISELKESLEKLPESMISEFDEIINLAVYCDNTCKTKKIYGEGFSGIEKIESCKQGEKEFLVEITGEEGLEILKGLRKEV